MPNKAAKRRKQLRAKKRKAIADYKAKKRREKKDARKAKLSEWNDN
tara:strand:+ start:493 stop:630 length:138 start_codon:yes stop_codon:yes gene_type:complete